MWPFKKKTIILSERKYIDYLPVGTIVRLYNDNQEYMIYRYLGNACMSFRYNDDNLKIFIVACFLENFSKADDEQHCKLLRRKFQRAK